MFYFKDGGSGGGGGGGLFVVFYAFFYDHYSFSFVSNCNAAVQLSGITNSLRAQQGALLLWPQRPCEVTISLVNQSLLLLHFRDKRKKERKEGGKKRGGGGAGSIVRLKGTPIEGTSRALLIGMESNLKKQNI